jgi:acyl carrier protein
VVDKLGIDEKTATPEASFVEDLSADSLDLVELIMAFEEEFSATDNKLEISDQDAGRILTIQDAVDYLEAHGIQDG